MKELPILFSAPMIRAILAGRKTQTRRLVKVQPTPDGHGGFWWPSNKARTMVGTRDMGCLGPYGREGDRLWVRETHGTVTGNGIRTVYRADGEEPKELLTDRTIPHMKWTPSIFMRRHQSRITLEVLDVRVERLTAISDDDIRAEGVDHAAVAALVGKPVIEDAPLRDLWQLGWDAINGERAPFASDPFVWVVSFRNLAQIGPSS